MESFNSGKIPFSRFVGGQVGAVVQHVFRVGECPGLLEYHSLHEP